MGVEVENKNSSEAGKEHRGLQSSESAIIPELSAARAAFRNSVGFQFKFFQYSGLEESRAIDYICKAADRLLAAVAPQWQPIETAPKMRKLLVGYHNLLGNWRTALATYWLEGALESETDDSGFAPEGWYEATEAYEYLMPVEQEPTHWMPLHAAPEVSVPERRTETTTEG